MMQVIDVDNQHGKVALVDSMKMDTVLKTVNMARGSLGKWVDEVSDTDETLVQRLIEEMHPSPFRHSPITIFIQCPLFVKNQLIKHQVGGAYAFTDVPWNEISGRYVTYDKFWTPEVLHKKGKIRKSGGTDEVVDNNAEIIQWYRNTQAETLKTYYAMINAGVAREEARTILGLYVYTSYFVTGSMQYWAHLVNLRTKPDAQRQTRAYAEVINTICENHYQWQWKKFVEGM
jgi:thymidylate synthase (FAD)